eukprot:gnl/Hemi2/26807_TR9014_c0_g1_i1.p1 gnl/Hemi2/26807_TR9014_c0_g1~~gnl/Hemi2/26807_TR9014_c0_g1_i1.p1  ORF type:complete len:413 (+),score=133.65 gnl/Hemi2/26807_TR9014_c0_g1_i1:105-1343(+)
MATTPTSKLSSLLLLPLLLLLLPACTAMRENDGVNHITPSPPPLSVALDEPPLLTSSKTPSSKISGGISTKASTDLLNPTQSGSSGDFTGSREDRVLAAYRELDAVGADGLQKHLGAPRPRLQFDSDTATRQRKRQAEGRRRQAAHLASILDEEMFYNRLMAAWAKAQDQDDERDLVRVVEHLVNSLAATEEYDFKSNEILFYFVKTVASSARQQTARSLARLVRVLRLWHEPDAIGVWVDEFPNPVTSRDINNQFLFDALLESKFLLPADEEVAGVAVAGAAKKYKWNAAYDEEFEDDDDDGGDDQWLLDLGFQTTASLESPRSRSPSSSRRSSRSSSSRSSPRSSLALDDGGARFSDDDGGDGGSREEEGSLAEEEGGLSEQEQLVWREQLDIALGLEQAWAQDLFAIPR